MKILGFETASGRCSVTISNNLDILANKIIFENSMQAESLISLIDESLSDAKLTINDIDYFATSNGPGSFTGIRIGLATILGITKATEKKPIITSNFEIINYRAREQYRDFDKVYSIIDAYRGECYSQIFDKSGKALSKPSLLKIEELRENILDEKSHIVCSGSGIIHLYDLAKKNVTILPRFPFPDSRIICKLSRNLILKNEFSSAIEPLYIRKPDAKIPIAPSSIFP